MENVTEMIETAETMAETLVAHDPEENQEEEATEESEGGEAEA